MTREAVCYLARKICICPTCVYGANATCCKKRRDSMDTLPYRMCPVAGCVHYMHWNYDKEDKRCIM